jgi:hypothetical protein
MAPERSPQTTAAIIVNHACTAMMNERQPYDKLIADKLQQLRGPDADESWQRMKQLLDDEQRPKGGGGNNSNTWWRIGIIAIVLVGSVIFFTQNRKSASKEIAAAPSVGDNSHADKDNGKFNKQKTTSTGDNSTLDNTDNKNVNKDASTGKENALIENGKEATVNTTVAANDKKSVAKTEAGKNNNAVKEMTVSTNPADKINGDATRMNDNSSDKATMRISKDVSKNNRSIPENKITEDRSIVRKDKSKNSSTTVPGSYTRNVAFVDRPSATKDSPNNHSLAETGRKNGLGTILPGDVSLITGRDVLKGARDETFYQTLYIVGTPVADKTETVEPESNTDVSGLVSTASKKSVTDNKKDLALLKKKKERKSLNLNLADVFLPFSLKRDGEPWWAVGISMNSSMPVSGQSRYNYNVNARSGTLSDYLPSPYVQYHMNDNVYVQTELNLSAPQHVPQLLISQSTQYSPTQTLQTSLYIQKLYYFNWPFSLHYSPVRNLFIAGGLQFSSLQSGVALQEKRDVSTAAPGTPSSFIYKFKDDTTAAKLTPTEWRWETGADYYWNRFTLGVRYNKAFKDVLNLNVSGTLPSTINRNSSFLLFMKYNLFEGRNRESRNSPGSLVRY